MKTFFLINFQIIFFVFPLLSQTLFTFRRHVQTNITNNDVDNRLADANLRLKIDNDRCYDVPCTARFERDGNVNTFGTIGDGLDIVTTEDELNQVWSQPDRVKIVTVLDVCGGEYNPSICGCGECPGNEFVLEVNQGGEVYIHEYGHNIGIHWCLSNEGHRTDCEWNIMDDDTDGTNDAVNQDECEDYGGVVNTQLIGNVFDGYIGPLTEYDGPYWVTGNVVVPAGLQLTIQQGTEIQFKHDHKITSCGLLNALCNSQNSILLFSNSTGVTGGPPPHYPSVRIYGEVKIKSNGELFLY